MRYSYSIDGRFLTPPKELKPLLKDAFPAFFKLLGHIRFFYMVDEIWDGKSTLCFTTNHKQLAVVVIEDSAFTINMFNNTYQVVDETILPNIFDALNKNAAADQKRPVEQLTANLDEFPNGIRCDLCQCNIINNTDDFSGKKKFRVMDRHCYYGVEEGWGETGVDYCPIICEGKQHCYASTFSCLEKKGFENCLECGEYHTCGNCGVGHNPGECNLGITAEEVTNLIIPYCELERLDYMALQNSGMRNEISKIGCHVYVNDASEAVKVYKEAFGLDSTDPWLDDEGFLISQELRLNGELFMSVCDKKHLGDVMKKLSTEDINPIMLFTVFFKSKDDLEKTQKLLCVPESPFSGIIEPETGVYFCDIIDNFGVMWHLCVPKDWNSSFIAK